MRSFAFILSFLAPAAALAHVEPAAHVHVGSDAISAFEIVGALTLVVMLVWGGVHLFKAARK